jgi:HlyD family secretion protein
MRKKWKIIIWTGVGILVLFIGLRSCGKSATRAAKTSAEIQTHTVAKGNINARIEISGEVQPQTVVNIKSRVSGKIVKFYFAENAFVKQGQVIADIEPDYNQANTLFNTKAQLKKAELRLAKARSDLADKQVLKDKGYISDEAFETSTDEMKNAEIEFTQASSQYEMIRDLDVPGKVTHVFATASGVVIERKVNEGEMVQSSMSGYGEGTVIMKIADLSRMIVKSNINEVDISRFIIGQSATIKLDALPYEEFQGSVVKIAPMAIVENNAKVFPVEISINASGEKAKPGMTAAVSIAGDSRENVLVIPIRAVFSDSNNQDIVYLMPKGIKASGGKGSKKSQSTGPAPIATPVKLGVNDLQMVEVVSGLSEGDVISLSEQQAPQFPGMM